MHNAYTNIHTLTHTFPSGLSNLRATMHVANIPNRFPVPRESSEVEREREMRGREREGTTVHRSYIVSYADTQKSIACHATQ
jgi:hypothetical protein